MGVSYEASRITGNGVRRHYCEEEGEFVFARPGLLIERDRSTFTKVERGLRSAITVAHADRLVRRYTGVSLEQWMGAS